MNSDPFERFINDKIDPAELEHIKPISVALNVDLKAFNERLSAVDPEMRAKIEAAMREQLGNEANRILARARCALFVGEGWTAGAYAAYSEQARRDHYTRAYGEDFVAEADELARTQGYDFDQAIALLRMRDVINRTGEQLRATFERIQAFLASSEVQSALNQIGEAMVQRLRDGIEQPSEPHNRHERRATRHAKPMKDGDQQWKQRNRRDYRSRR